VTIAEIDTGVNARLPELAGRILRGRDLGQGGDGRVDRDISPFGHGTAMASIMVGRPGPLGIRGLAPGARILPIAVPVRGTTQQSMPGMLPQAISWAADHGAKIINMSIGGQRYPGAASGPCPSNEQRAVFHALDAGAVVIAAVGNSGSRTKTVEEPGVCLGVVAVGAEDRAGAVARFSAREPYVSLVAPGVNVPSLGRIARQVFSGSGTSQASALVSATAALVWSRYPELTGDELVSRLLATLQDHRLRSSEAYGFGSLDAYRAVTARVPAGAPNPVYSLAAPFRQRAVTLARGLGAPPRRARTSPLPRPHLVARADRSPPGATAHLHAGVALAVVGAGVLLLLGLFGISQRRFRAHFS
jgi:subtilisin family serine protease